MKVLLEELSLTSSYNRSLRSYRLDKVTDLTPLLQDLKKFDKAIYKNMDKLDRLGLSYRIKAENSVRLKYERYKNTSRSVQSVFNDILGIRHLVEDYLDVPRKEFNQLFNREVVFDGLKNGYRGIHYYYSKDNYSYTIELQVNTVSDRWFNDLLHIHVYKKLDDAIGVHLYKLYAQNKITNESEFKEWLEWVQKH